MRSVWSLRAAAGVGLSAGLLISCNVVRPAGAYDAAPYEPPDAAAPDDDEDGGGTVITEPDPEAGVVEEEASVPPSRPDGGSGDGGMLGALTPEEENLQRLEGRYWVRLDVYSASPVTVSGITLNVRTRLSQLILTQLNLDRSTEPPALVSDEKLCYVTFAHACSSGAGINCEAQTSIPDAATNRLRPGFVSRRYTIDNSGTLTTNDVPVALGYDAEGGAVGPLPQNGSDTRVWDITAGGAREGLWTQLDASATALGITNEIGCHFYVVQRFVSAFSGVVPGWADQAPALDNVAFALDTTGSELEVLQTLQTQGTEGCDAASPETVLGGISRPVARFARVVDQPGDEFWLCPGTLGAFDGRLPADPP